jgi:acyl-CoA synthetase (AMP-forming)/AMP-acid ligase II
MAASSAERYGITAGNVYLVPAPLYHAAPLAAAMSSHRNGVTAVVMERFDPELCLSLIERYHVTHAQFVPTMFVRMLALPAAQRERHDLSSLKIAIHAAAPCPIEVKERLIDWWGPIVYEYYAGTEDIGGTALTSEEWLAHKGSVGKPNPAITVHILGPDGEELSAGVPGPIYFDGGRSFEYHNDPAKTASIVGPHGWRTLGDIGYLDGDGYLYLTDRQSHMIVSGGVNIYPQEAENALVTHPAVEDVAVIGVPNAEYGEEVKAVVQLRDQREAGAAMASQLIEYCRARLARYKCPRSVDFVEEMPRDPNGKLYKRRLREKYWADHATSIV